MSGTVLLIGTALTLGLGGSLHCLGMCGPLVFSLPFLHPGNTSKATSVLLYHSGRILAYTVLGAIIFALGKSLQFAGMSRYISFLMGSIMLIFALFPRFIRTKPNGYTNRLRIAYDRATRWVFAKDVWIRIPMAGFLNGLLPCGLIYVALGSAMATTTTLPAYLFMLLFGIGTLPMMLGVSLAGLKLIGLKRARLKLFTPLLSITVAILLILRGLNLGIPLISPKDTVEQGGHRMECCKKLSVNS